MFQLSIEFLSEATANEEAWHFESGHSDELLRRLLVFLAKEKKYCVRFVDQSGVELSLKYLRRKFKIIRTWKEKLPSLEKPFLLLGYCCEKDVNFKALEDKKLQKLIGVVVLYTFGYFAEMPTELQAMAMRFTSVVLSIAHIRDFVADKHGRKLLGYLLKFQRKTDPEKQSAKAIRCLFESLNFLCATRSFQALMLAQREPYLYEVFLHSMTKFTECAKVKVQPDADDKKAQYEYEQLQFSISVLLDGVAMLFDGGHSDAIDNSTSAAAQKEEADKQRDARRKVMVGHFVRNKNIDKYMTLLRDYLRATNKRFKKVDAQDATSEQNAKDTQRYLGQLGKCVNVFTALARSALAHPASDMYFGSFE